MPLLNKWDFTEASTHISSVQHNLALLITEVLTHTYTCSLSSGDNQCKTSTGSIHVNINILILISLCHYPTIMRWYSQKLDPFKTKYMMRGIWFSDRRTCKKPKACNGPQFHVSSQHATETLAGHSHDEKAMK